MKRTMTLLLFILSLGVLYGRQVLPKLYKRSLPAIVKIQVLHYDGTAAAGTGFFIDEKTIVTCYHVAANAKAIDIRTSDGKKFTVDSVLASNRAIDVIKFTVKEKNSVWLKACEKLPVAGESVFMIGNPDGDDFSISAGIVSAIRIGNSVVQIQTTAPCSAGSSGSPLMNEKGEVIGVMYFIKFFGQNLNFAASSLYLKDLKDDNSINELTPVLKKISKQELDSILDLAKSYMLIKDYKKCLLVVLPVTKYLDSTQYLETLEMIGDCYEFQGDYNNSVQYYELLISSMNKMKVHTPEQMYSYAQTLEKLGLCYFTVGNNEGALNALSNSAELCKNGLQKDSIRKELYVLLIQLVYITDASVKYSMKHTEEACLSWNLARQYGYKKDDFGFNAICK